MSIERDKDFEQLEDIAAMMAENPGIEFENGKYVYYGLDGRTAFAAVYISGAWMAWQAKAQAVPKGFVLVPVNPSDEFIDKLASVICDEFDTTISGSAHCAKEAYKAVIEAQEPK